jgi:hypothetical protein
MKQRTNVVLLAVLASASAGAQDISVYGTTMAQIYKQETPGFDKTTYTTGTQFLGIDATKLGTDALSMHLFGWGMVDFKDASRAEGGKSGGDLSYGYLDYRFAQANAQIKAGRFAINQGSGIEQVDGISGRADLRGGFTISAFAGKPVLYRSLDDQARREYELQRDFIWGTRLGWRPSRMAEFGVSYLQDGSRSFTNFPNRPASDYTRRQVTGDVRITPAAGLDLSGRTVLDVADHYKDAGKPEPSKVAEHDYTLQYRFTPMVAVSTSYTERNFQAYFLGSNMPNLFNQVDKDKHRGTGANLILGSADALSVIADYRRIERESYGTSNRAGADLRYNFGERKFQAGLGYHRISGPDKQVVGVKIPSFGLSYKEARGWVMYEGAKLSASLDGIMQKFDDKNNPSLNGQQTLYEAVASLGVKASEHLKFSGDLSIGQDPMAKQEVRGILRSEFRFGFAGKGSSK